MQLNCPYCESSLEVETGSQQARCPQCERAFPVQEGAETTCPKCGCSLTVPEGADAVLCGQCGYLISASPPAGPESPQQPPPSARRHSPTNKDTTVFESPEDHRQAQLRAVQEEFSDRYEVLECLGRGGMGIIYKARQKQPERVVVLKVMLNGRFASEKYHARFEREVQAVARLKHPGIVSVYEFGEVNGQPYFTMEYVEGCSVKEYVLRHELGKNEICRLMLDICRAVAYAHQRGVIHRDIKPSNILVDGAGNPRLLDFGLAHLAGDYGPEEAASRRGEVMGTPAYMSPEQVGGRPDEIDIRTDVFSLGVLFYELLTRRVPKPLGGGPDEPMRSTRRYLFKPPSELDPAIDADLDAIVMKALAEERNHRYQSAVEMAEDLVRYLQGWPVEAGPSTSWYYLRKLVWRRRYVALPIVLLGLAALAAAGVFVWDLHKRERRARAAAATARQQRQELVNFLIELDAVRSSVDDLMIKGRWQEAFQAAVFAEEHLPQDAGYEGFTEAVRSRLAAATTGEADQVRKLVRQLLFRNARERLRRLEELAAVADLPELAEQVNELSGQFEDECYQSVLSYIQRNGGGIRVLEEFLAEWPQNRHADEARSLLVELRKHIRYSEWPFDAEQARRRQEETARTLGIPARRTLALTRDTELALVLIPAGEYDMGVPAASEKSEPDQSAPHRVRIPDPFYMSATEITRRQFEEVIGRVPDPPEGLGDSEELDDLPVAVSWEEARRFCLELGRRRDLQVRLPTEAEWEYACRAGAKELFGHAGSPEALTDYAWCQSNSGGTVHAVAGKRPNVWGLYDVHGNLLEWCHDWYDSRYYFSSPLDNPQGPEEGRYKVLRGGSYADEVADLHVAFRRAYLPDARQPMYGFRICVEPFAEQRELPVTMPILSPGGPVESPPDAARDETGGATPS